MKKVNPRRRPATWADVERAKNETADKAILTAMCIFLTVLVDKFGGADYIQDVWKELNKLSGEIVEGRVSIKDLMIVLHEEYGIEVGRI